MTCDISDSWSIFLNIFPVVIVFLFELTVEFLLLVDTVWLILLILSLLLICLNLGSGVKDSLTMLFSFKKASFFFNKDGSNIIIWIIRVILILY